jgi:uncharacterized iron-regulated membrane protein
VIAWQRWIYQPQSAYLRKALFQVHLWTGLATGVYVVAICLSGSVLVYRNELYRTFSPQPVLVSGRGSPLSDEALAQAARDAYPGYDVGGVRRGPATNEAVEIRLQRGEEAFGRLFHPFTGQDLGNAVPAGYRFTTWLLDFHDNLLGGATGRRINGIGALLVIVLCITGAVIWWPGIGSWRRSLTISVRSSAKRLIWSLHSALGLWFFGFILLWGITGTYLAFPDAFAAVFDYIQPFDETDPSERIVDRMQYWLAYLHFGRLGGRGIPGCGRGLCDAMTKVTWAGAALIPPVMFVTGAVMWWNRVLGPAIRRSTQRRGM